MDALEAWSEAISNQWVDDSTSADVSDQIGQRLNLRSASARTVDFTGRRVPYDDGRAWTMIPQLLVPRIFNPDKPLMTGEVNDRYSVRFEIQTTRGTHHTTVALPLVADGYWDFGFTGMIFAGLAWGIYIGFGASLWRSGHWSLR